jgi:acyl-coenzyme A synthetase/AMP-(fatty) acid ligase
VRNVQAQAKRLKLEGQSQAHAQTHTNPYIIIGTVPPQHMYGLESTVLLPLQSGNVLTGSRPFYPADICSAIEAAPMPRILVSSPVHLRLLLEAGLELPEVRMVLSATAPLSPQLAEALESGFDAPLLEIYGSTETGQVATRHTTQTAEWHLLPRVNLLPQGNRIWAAGGHVDMPTPLNDIIEMIEADGGRHFLLHGRTADLINIAGKRNSLANLNHQLNAIPGVIDGVFFMPQQDEQAEHTDPHGHVTRLSACVVAPTLNKRSLMAALRERVDPAFLPRPLLFVETLPRNTMGKLPRQSLEALFTGAEMMETDLEAVSPDPA